jgi:phage repressor protein C with HTH and peptisase S24 domain
MVRSDTKQNIQAVSEELRINEKWLLDGDGQKRRSLPERKRNRKTVTHYGPASAGDGRTLQPIGEVELTEGEYRARFGARSADRVGLFEIEGDSAAPIYFDGEHIPVEMKGETQDFREDTVCVFRYRDDIMVKRLRTLGDGSIRAESLNPGIDDRVLHPDGDNFEIVGRVIDNPKQQLYTSMIGRFMRHQGQDGA